MLANEIQVLRDYVMYRVEKESKKEKANNSLALQWENKDKSRKSSTSSQRLPKLWQMSVKQRYDLLSKS